MARNKIYTATVKATGAAVKVWVLRQPTKPNHVWANYEDGGKTTYTDSELKVDL